MYYKVIFLLLFLNVNKIYNGVTMNEQALIDLLNNEIKKLKYHITLLNNYSFHKMNPLDSLVISLNWSEEDLDKAHDIFEKYFFELKAKKEISCLYSLIEQDFEKDLNIGYQLVKTVILSFFRENLWTEVCIAFVKSQGENPPIEFSEIISYIKENNL